MVVSTDARTELGRLQGRGVTVAVVDSGWCSEKPDARVLPGRSVLAAEGDSTVDIVGHGTLCGARVLQVAPQARIIPIKVFSRRLETSVQTLCRGIAVACEFEVDVINLSLATQLEDAIRPLYELCERARRDGIIVVASAHNQHVPAVPAYLEPVLSVGEGRQHDLLDFTFDPDGPVECTAAGSAVPILLTDGRTRPRAGSSVAAATMSGIVARLVQGGSGDLDSIRARLRTLASPMPHPPMAGGGGSGLRSR
ncbi:MAG: S8 family serine peptidase [Gemmatimonadetes bacterium]|nr:S8 family serine peptidase [Gemmatimonadota bacterium]